MSVLAWVSRGVAGRVSFQGLVKVAPLAARDAAYALAALLALVWAYLFVRWGFQNGVIGFDFKGTLWDSAIAVRSGTSPYPEAVVSEVEVGNPALYPPLLMVLVAPLTVVPWWAGVVAWSIVLIASVVGALWILGVRDPRCFALALISAPAINGFVWGNATLLLLPLIALAWKWRDDSLRAGAVLGVAIAAKLFVWPLAFWLLGSRRYRAALTALAVAVVSILGPWVAIGFDGFRSYPALLEVAAQVYATHSYSVATVAGALGASAGVAVWGALVVGVATAVMAVIEGRRGHDETALSLASLAVILGSPIVWDHYYILLLVPLAILRPRFSAPWVLLALFYWTHRLPRPRLLSSELEPGGEACCKPAEVPMSSWVFSHAPAGLWPALGHAILAVVLLGLIFWPRLRAALAVGGVRSHAR